MSQAFFESGSRDSKSGAAKARVGRYKNNNKNGATNSGLSILRTDIKHSWFEWVERPLSLQHAKRPFACGSGCQTIFARSSGSFAKIFHARARADGRMS